MTRSLAFAAFLGALTTPLVARAHDVEPDNLGRPTTSDAVIEGDDATETAARIDEPAAAGTELAERGDATESDATASDAPRVYHHRTITAAAMRGGRPWAFQIGMGPVISLENGGAIGKLGLDFQYHFRGDGTGPALGLQLPMLFDSHLFGMNIGPIFLWDFRVYQAGNASIDLAPMIALGYGFFTSPPNSGALHYFFMDFGGQFKMLFNDWIGFYVRPITFSMWAGEHFVTGTWSMLAGLAIAF